MYDPVSAEIVIQIESGKGFVKNKIEGVFVNYLETDFAPIKFGPFSVKETEFIPSLGIGITEVICNLEKEFDKFFRDVCTGYEVFGIYVYNIAFSIFYLEVIRIGIVIN